MSEQAWPYKDDPTGAQQIEDALASWDKPQSVESRRARFRSWAPALYWQTIDYLYKGRENNWRNFGVGAAGLAYRSDRSLDQGGIKVFFGHNSKESPEVAKHCAERRVLEAAIAEGYDAIDGLVVVGDWQLDDKSGHECTTLHPCAECRNMLLNSPLIDLDMLIYTFKEPPEEELVGDRKFTPVYEVHTLREILQIHDNYRDD